MAPLRSLRTGALLVLAFVAAGNRLPAQVLARPGWAGSGVATEPWWRSAVFYRIDPERFQDSGSSGRGDLAGIATRLDYVQALGVDAIVLDGDVDLNGLDDLVRAGSEHHIRTLLTVTPAMQAGDRQALLATVHGWMTAGVAGLWLPKPVTGAQQASAASGYPSLLALLNTMLRGIPGARVLLTDPSPEAVGAGPAAARTSARGAVAFGQTPGGVLTTVTAIPVQPTEAAALRQSLQAIAEGNAPGVTPLLRFAQAPHTGSPEAGALAAVLLASRGAAMFEFGDEIGLDAFSAGTTSGAALPVMQWTPANVQQAAAPVERAAAPNPGAEYGPYRPYVHPPPARILGTAPVMPHASVDGNIPAPLPSPDTLPGFTTGKLPAPPIDASHINVTTEDRDPNSLLHAYRELIALHHGDATLRNGAQAVLNRNAQNALVWVRRAPAGARAVGSVVIAANLGDQPVTLSLDADLPRLGMHPGPLRALFTFGPGALTGESTGSLRLPAHAVYIGEVYR